MAMHNCYETFIIQIIKYDDDQHRHHRYRHHRRRRRCHSHRNELFEILKLTVDYILAHV